MEDYDRIATKHQILMQKVKDFKKEFAEQKLTIEKLQAENAMLLSKIEASKEV
jgi:hypothetical protein